MRPLPVSNTQVFTLAERAFFTITSSFLNHLNSSFVVFFLTPACIEWAATVCQVPIRFLKESRLAPGAPSLVWVSS